MRADDPRGKAFFAHRRAKELPQAQVFLKPGHLLIPDHPLAVGAVVASSVVVTLFDRQGRRGGLCHYLRARARQGQPNTPVFGRPAVTALLRGLLPAVGSPTDLLAGIYGGASPGWASIKQAEQSCENVLIAKQALAHKKIHVADMDVGGTRGRKLCYLTGTNEIMVIKTDEIRRTDWFPAEEK